MNDSELSYLMAALQCKFGWLIFIASWQTLLRLVMVFINKQIRNFLENSIPEDSAWAKSLFDKRFYRVSVFIFNALLSIKLPTIGAKPSESGTSFFKN